MHALFSSLSFCYQYQCNWLPGKIRPGNDLLCVEWDVKPYLTQSLSAAYAALRRAVKAKFTYYEEEQNNDDDDDDSS